MAFRRSATRASVYPNVQERDGQTVSLGMEHLAAIGEASASLGLISTLVFGICMNSIMSGDDDHHEIFDLFIGLATSCSTYTTVYSLLEFYYVMTLKGVERSMVVRARVGSSSARPSTASTRGSTSSAPGGFGGDHSGGEDSDSAMVKPGDHSGTVNDCIDMVLRVEHAFAGFNEMRMFARNCMWCSLISLIGAGIARINPFSGHEPDITSSTKTGLFFAWMVLSTLTVSQLGFQSRDVWGCMAGSSVCGGLAGVISRYDKENSIPTAKIFSSLMLVATISIVPLTVKAFRFTFLPMAQEQCDIY